MKKLILLLVSSILVVGTFGCQEAPKTGSETPSTTNEAAQVPAKPASVTNETAKLPAIQTTPLAAGTDTKVKTSSEKTAATKVKSDLKTEVSTKLNKGLPGNKLQVENKEGEIILKGTATSAEELKKAETLAKEVQGVKTVKIEAKVEAVKKP
ncbi:MAG: BON domain-containing protein [Nostoc sp. DedVER02]|uniref:BON domain-containing protein n=1 Tax=unclassified Nostoc TaxID=2593658 RepID=UPI002AD53D61|nr:MULTISPECIES: BON domain-containing protein [unclassified Nostoc]MDZ7985941.1 BON domain-containing protein [Nostoc sp. DedVER02]MDZ8111500.1 BON domain-containing protein [Nostoc sp. DedVER01b]